MSSSSHNHAHGSGGLRNILGERTEMTFAVASGVFWLAGLLLGWLTSTPAGTLHVLFGAAVIFGGFFTSLDAVDGIRHRRFDIDFLMLVAAAGAIALDRWQEAALLLFLFSLGHALEHYAMRRARKSIEALAELAPPTALLQRGQEWVEVPIEELQLGDLILVKPNTKIPADGFIVAGNSTVDQSAITGESMPVDKIAAGSAFAKTSLDKLAPQHRAFAGTLNGAGALELRVLAKAEDSTVAKLVRLVQDAEAQKSPTQHFTDRVQRVYVPAVLIGVTLLLFAFLVLDESFGESFYRAMAVLVAASPCALAISTPSAVLAGISRAAQKGVLVKGGGPLEHLGLLDAIALDKTGTLTEGKPRLVTVESANGGDATEVLRLAVALERHSDHPLAAAIVEDGLARLNGVALPEAHALEALTSRGVRAQVDGQMLYLGNRRLFEEVHQQEVPQQLSDQLAVLERQGQTAILLGTATEFLGYLGVMDTPREGAREVLRELRDLGIRRMLMLTGDNQRVADAVALQLGISDPLGGLLPEDKVAAVERLREEAGGVAMIGDGVNDAPAMARSTVGIAMGSAGSDVALETADIALMGDQLERLPFVIGLSRKAHQIIQQNLYISLGMVAILVPLTLVGIAEIGPAVIGHEGSTLVVVANALRLLRYGKGGGG